MASRPGRADSPKPMKADAAKDASGKKEENKKEKKGKLHAAPSNLAVGAFLTDDGLNELARFKYVAGPYTPLDNLLNPWWLYVAKFVPAWVSPNLVTLTGLILTLGSMAVGVIVCNGEAGSFVNGHPVYLLIAVGCFAYQTLDAVDGKHARNTGQATPLGALFDHGCDALAATAGVLAIELCSSTPGTEAEEARTAAGLVAFILPPISFFAAQWEHLYTHEMPAGGVTEAQYCGIGTMMLAFLFGPILFQADLSTVLPGPMVALLSMLVGGPKGLLLKRVMHFGTTVFAAVLTTGSVFRCVRHSTYKCLIALLPAALLSVLCCILFAGRTNVFVEHRLLCQMAAGMVIADLNVRMVIGAVCRFAFPVLPITLLPFTIACFAGHILPLLGVSGVVHFYLLVGSCMWQLFSILALVVDTINKVCAKLDIPFLTAMDQRKKIG